MGGKKGVSAKEKAAEKAKGQAAADAKAREDAYWAAAGEGKKNKAQARRSTKDDERQEAANKRLEARRMAQEEEASLASTAKKGATAAQKVTQFELGRQKEAEAEQAAQDAVRREQQKRREVGEEDYARVVEFQHDNLVDGISARSIDDAIAQLKVEEGKQPKMKFSQYLERELPEMKAQKPGLKAPQYKDMIWKKWLRSPENPLNQKAAA